LVGVTDALGVFHLSSPALEVSVVAEGYCTAQFGLGSAGSTGATLPLHRTAVVSGYVQNESGRRLEGVAITAMCTECVFNDALGDVSALQSCPDPEMHVCAATSGSNGEFSLAALIPGARYRVFGSAEGFRSARQGLEAFPSNQPLILTLSA